MKKINIISANLASINGNFWAGVSGLIFYPSINLLTGFPIAGYSLVCYGVHHLHILQCLQNIASVHDSNEIGTNKYINYSPFSDKYTFDMRRKSILSLKIKTLNTKQKNFWWCKTIPLKNLSFESQYEINNLINIRDNATKTSIALFILPLTFFLNVKSIYGFLIPYEVRMIIGLKCSFLFTTIFNFLTYMIRPRVDMLNTTKELSKLNPELKKYYYINTFGLPVLTNFKYGLYKRFKF
jgi:hypothetical protein